MQQLSKEEVLELNSADQEELCHHLRWHLTSELDAQDLAQEASLRVLRVSGRGREVKDRRASLFTITKNLVDERRARELAGGGRVSDQALMGLESPDPSPEERAERHRQLELVKRVPSELSPKCWAVVKIRTHHGMTCREVVEALGV